MNIADKKQVIGYLVTAGFVAYVFAAMLSSIFIIAVDMDDGWCIESMEFQTGPDSYEIRCIEFKNRFEEYKYYHNHDMKERNKYLIGGNFALFLAMTFLLFHFVPKWQGENDRTNHDKFFLLFLLSFGVVVIMPLIFGFVLPAPIEWFPKIFVEIHEKQIEATLLELKEIAAYE